MTSERVWWGNINIPFSPQNFDFLLKNDGVFNNKNLFTRDVFTGADKRALAYGSSMRPLGQSFVRNMFIQPNEKELKNFQHDWLVLNIPSFQADLKLTIQDNPTSRLSTFPKRSFLLVV